LYGFIGILSIFILNGFLLLLLMSVWYIVRCVKGLMALDKEKPTDNVETWLW